MRSQVRVFGVVLGLALLTSRFGDGQGQRVAVQSEMSGSVGLRLNGGSTVTLAGRSTISLDLKSGKNELSLWSCGWPDCRWIPYAVEAGQVWLVAREGPEPRIVLTKTSSFLIYPRNAISYTPEQLKSDTPTIFRWAEVPGATSYEVYIKFPSTLDKRPCCPKCILQKEQEQRNKLSPKDHCVSGICSFPFRGPALGRERNCAGQPYIHRWSVLVVAPDGSSRSSELVQFWSTN
jgi:hypothetical protein